MPSRGRDVSYWRVLLLLLRCEARQAKAKKKKRAKKITSASTNTSGVLVRLEFKTVL